MVLLVNAILAVVTFAVDIFVVAAIAAIAAIAAVAVVAVVVVAIDVAAFVIMLAAVATANVIGVHIKLSIRFFAG